MAEIRNVSVEAHPGALSKEQQADILVALSKAAQEALDSVTVLEPRKTEGDDLDIGTI